ncbi:DNA mismatch repair protein MutS [soil metagenome]
MSDQLPADQHDLFLTESEQRRQNETPLMRQYWKIKDRHPGAILLFRMGDFYETFYEDARLVAEILGITLTKRGSGAAEDVPLAGFPHHSLDQYLPRLVQAGHRVAVCEQLEDPKLARKIVKRGVVEVVTPGVSLRDQLLTPKRSHFLAAVAFADTNSSSGKVGFAFVDASTGEFQVAEIPDAQLESMLQTVAPAELLIDKRLQDRLRGLRAGGYVVTPQEDWVFGHDFAYEALLRHFQTHSLKGFGVEDLTIGLVAAGAALYYLGETQKGRLPHVRRIQRYEADSFMSLDPETKRNLELIASINESGKDGSLVGVLDKTLTPMGGRLLHGWLLRPLRDVAAINRRLDSVEALHRSHRFRQSIADEMKHVGDLERLCARVCTGRATPRDLVTLSLTLKQIPPLKRILADEKTELLERVREGLTLCSDIVERIDAALVEDPPAQLSAGGYIRDGYSAQLDELREIARGGKAYLVKLQTEEAERTGITSLKVGYNRVFGYYLEISNTHKAKVPSDYIRKQTLVGAERYITPALKQYEEKILTAEEKIGEVEQQLFGDLRMQVAESVEPIQQNARYLALLDVLTSLAVAAEQHRYVRPVVDDGLTLDIDRGRHPVVERLLPVGEPFIPNSVQLDADGGEDGQIHLITGPNMAGKSVVLRQTGLIVLLAQVGSFVPADRARIGIVDKIFTRVGASDNLAAGESTFLVEMNETANILNNATRRSLVLLDEVGRGTSTFDGLSIAWAVVEYLHENDAVAARTLFATHYHELNALADRLERVRSFRVQVQEHGGQVIFLRTLAPGGADHSYGIEVARMAGLPKRVLDRAKEVLTHLERHDVASEVGVEGHVPPAGDSLPARRRAGSDRIPESAPVALAVPDPVSAEILDRLARIDPEQMTPLEAMLALAELKRKAERHA